MATWPVSLPQSPLIQGNNEQAPNNVIRTPMDVGPPKVRRRATAGVRNYTYQFHMTTTQVATLDTFYNDTLSGGSLEFDWTNPRTNNTEYFRFVTPPIYQKIGPDLWLVNINLEQLP